MPEDIRINQLSKNYHGKKVLDELSFTIKSGAVTALMAHSGAGKTTLLRILMGLEEADSGSVEGLRGLRLSAVFQEDRLCGNLSPLSNIRLTAGTHFPRQVIMQALEETDLLSCATQPVRELSGGQSRRVALLRALLSPYDLLLLDEPFKGLDTKTRHRIMDYTLTSIRRDNDDIIAKTVLLVTHDETEASYMADEILQPFSL